MRKERFIWGDTYEEYQTLEKDVKDNLEEFFDDRAVEEITNEDIYLEASYLISQYLEDEQGNLNKELNNNIIAIADMGLWNGRRIGYKELGSNLNNIFDIMSDENYFYGDGYNIKSRQTHHDGTNYILYRVYKDNITEEQKENFENKIYNGEKISNSTLNYYTKSLYPYVKEIYGW